MNITRLSKKEPPWFELGKTAAGEIDELLAGRSKSISVSRYQTSKIRIEGAFFHAQTKHSGSGLMENCPVLFTGYGHFTQVRNDIEKFLHYGVNLIQVEFGPRSVESLYDACLRTISR